jgi:hypothetical protein
MEKIGYVYKITDLDNGMEYIGSSTKYEDFNKYSITFTDNYGKTSTYDIYLGFINTKDDRMGWFEHVRK